MSLVWLPLLGLGVAVLAVFLVVRRLRETREHADRLGSRLAAVLEGYAAGLSVWDVDSRLVACNQRFREFYPGVPLKPGLVLEDLTRFTVTRGLVQVPEDEVEAWVLDRMTRFRGVAREVVRTASGRWLEIRSMPTDHGEVLLLYADATETHDTRSALSDRSERLDQQSADLALLRRAVELAGVAESFDGAVRQVVDLICEWAGWPVGHAYRVSSTDAGQLESMRVWRSAQDEAFAPFRAAVEQEVLRPGDGVAGRALRSGRVIWIANVVVDPATSDSRREVMPGVRGVCAVPIKSRGKVVAVLEFLAREQLSPSASATQLLEGVAEALGWVFERHDLATH